MKPKGDKIKAGKKTLKFLGIKQSGRKLTKKLDDLIS